MESLNAMEGALVGKVALRQKGPVFNALGPLMFAT